MTQTPIGEITSTQTPLPQLPQGLPMERHGRKGGSSVVVVLAVVVVVLVVVVVGPAVGGGPADGRQRPLASQVPMMGTPPSNAEQSPKAAPWSSRAVVAALTVQLDPGSWQHTGVGVIDMSLAHDGPRQYPSWMS